MTLQPVQLYGLRVPVGAEGVQAMGDFPSEEPLSFRFTMAAIDPTAAPKSTNEANGAPTPLATLKVRRYPMMDDEPEDDNNELADLLDDEAEEDDEEESDADADTAGPSDTAKSRKGAASAKRSSLSKKLDVSKTMDDEANMDIDESNGINGTSGRTNKGKAKVADLEEANDDEENEEQYEEFVICTLDPTKNYQQPLDITVHEGDGVEFFVTGTHDVYLTGNTLVHIDEHGGFHGSGDEDEEDYDLSPDEDELELDGDEESDELDDMDDPRITEIESEDEAPKLIKAAERKGKNKRAAEESEDDVTNLDSIISKSLKPEPATDGEQKLSKKQMKKLKNNAGAAVAPASAEAPATKEPATPAPANKDSPASSSKVDKKVQFAKNLEQGPTGSPKPQASSEAAKSEKQKGNVKVIQGVKIDDRKQGSGPAAKKGDKVGMRYIGKLESNGKQFDANKKGKPFAFKLGAGVVIKGWDIGIVGMSAGGERRLTIPANMAYGSKGMPGIPPNSTLVFDVKLLSVN